MNYELILRRCLTSIREGLLRSRVSRPPFAQDAVQWLPTGRVRLLLPRKASRIDMSPEQFLAKLVALVPPPNLHLVRYAGVFANAHHLRRAIAPKPQHPNPAPPSQAPLFDFEGKPRSIARMDLEPPKPKRVAWAKLLAHVFALDIQRCPCGGRLRIVAVVIDPDDIAAVLHGARAPPTPPSPGQLFLAFPD